jgi:biotin synthase
LSPERTREEDKALFELANTITEHYYGKTIFFRGIIEHSNVCQKDCQYCGIRKYQPNIHRYTMPKEEIIEQALWAYDNKYGSICLQSGELNTEKRINMIEEVIKEIKGLK